MLILFETNFKLTMPHPHGHVIDLEHNSKSRMRIVFLLTFIFMIVEAIYGYIANSLALLADAGHMLNDVASLLFALIALQLSSLNTNNPSLTYGYKRVEVLSGLANGISLLFVAGYIIKEAVERVIGSDHVQIHGKLMLVVAVLGLLVNILGVLLLKDSHENSINIEGAYQHIIADMLGSIAAIIAAIGIIIFQAYWLDMLASLIVSVLVFKSGLHITMKALNILIEAIPAGIDIDGMKAEILAVDGVNGIYDLHAWTLTDGMDIVTAHITIDSENFHHAIKINSTRIAKNHGFNHITFQIECEPCDDLRYNCGNDKSRNYPM